MLRILVDMQIEEDALRALRQFPDVDVRVVPDSTAERELPTEELRDAEVLLCTTPPSNFREMERVRWVQISSSGYTQLFRHDLPARNIRATNARGCFDVPIAEWNIAMMINLVRDLPQMFRNQQTQTWDRSPRFANEVRGGTVGFWGYGGLARETARLAKAMGMRVHVLVRNGVQRAGDTYRVPGTGDPDGTLPDRVFLAGSEQEFLSELDFLVLAMPLTSRTEGMIGERELRALRPTAFVLNPARGAIIQEQALLRALREGWIAGAALDTHYYYPMPAEHPLWSMPNVMMTPHVAGTSLAPVFRTRIWDLFLENVRRYQQGKALLNELTLDQLNGL